MTIATTSRAGGIRVHRTVETIPVANAIEPVIDALDAHRGVLLASSYEYPGRYTRWDMGFVDPPLVLVARGRAFRVEALNERGLVLLPPIAAASARGRAVERPDRRTTSCGQGPRAPMGASPRRSAQKQPSVFSVLRALLELFRVDRDEDAHLGLYGAFGYDLAFQFEPIDRGSSAGRPARPRPLPAGRADRRGPSARGRPAPALRVRGRRPRHRRPPRAAATAPLRPPAHRRRRVRPRAR